MMIIVAHLQEVDGLWESFENQQSFFNESNHLSSFSIATLTTTHILIH